MKFILVISLCSFINNQCLTPVQIKGVYNSWKECTIAALEISKQLIIAQELMVMVLPDMLLRKVHRKGEF